MAPSLEKNKALWRNHPWGEQGEEWSRPWGNSLQQWLVTIYPRIHSRLPAGTALEIGSGAGRWTQYLAKHCERLIGVDLDQDCVESLRRRFSSNAQISFHLGDGLLLPMVADGSIDFIFSFDSLVHADPKVMESYLKEFSRVLSPRGSGFIHHSNLGQYESPPNSNVRDERFSAGLFKEMSESSGLFCLSQEKLSWGENGVLNDCFSAFSRTAGASPFVLFENALFPLEPEVARARHQAYGER